MLGRSFLDEFDAQKGRWRDTVAEAKGISTLYYWIGRGRDALEVAYGTAGGRPNATAVREVWKQRHGRGAAPLLVVVAYPKDRPRRATVCGPAAEDPPVVDLDRDHAERLARAALAEPDRHVAIRFLATALEGHPDEQPGLRNKGLLARRELLHGVLRAAEGRAQAVAVFLKEDEQPDQTSARIHPIEWKRSTQTFVCEISYNAVAVGEKRGL